MIRPDYLTRCLRERLRLWCTLTGKQPAWLLPVHFDAKHETFLAVRSTPIRSEILEITIGFLRGRQVQRLEVEPVEVEPLVLAGNHPIHASQHGHNGVAEAVLLLSLQATPVVFGYRKAGAKDPETRHVLLQWSAGERFGGKDSDRGDASRTFRLDRVEWICPADTAIKRPVWTGDSYSQGLP